MEFETTATASEDDRRLAEAKKLTLQPLHADVIPDAPHDSEIASRHILEPALANASNDTEEGTTIIPPTQSLLDSHTAKKGKTHKLLAGVTFGSIAFVGLTIFALLK